MTEIENVTNQYIDYDFNLPDNKNELCDAEDRISKIRIDLDLIYFENKINNNLHDKYYNKIVWILDKIGQLSMTAFEINNKLEDMYFLKYKHSPALAKKLWQEHYENIHRPYNILKNRCYRMLDALDENYITNFNINPPNWKI